MAKFHHKSSTGPADPNQVLGVLEKFLAGCTKPAALEDGEEPMALLTGSYFLELRASRLWLEAWNETRTLSRRILNVVSDIGERRSHILRCSVHRFGNAPGRLTLVDLARPTSAHHTLVSQRGSFAERFRRMLSRQFPGWQIAHLASSLDLQRSFSSVFPRARLVRGEHTIAAVACPSADHEPGALTAALLWFDYVAARARPGATLSLCIFLPEGAGCLTAQRLRWLTGPPLQARIFLFNEHGCAGEVDRDDLGNLETKVSASYPPAGPPLVPASSLGKLEADLELAVRRSLEVIDPTLLLYPVYSQVLTFVSGDRNLIDMLAVSRDGRLCVIELKAEEDLQLPVQSLDYWMRIRWHASRSELLHLFPGTPLSPEPPRLLLLGPATAFHPANTAVLRYFSPEIQVERIGVNSDWNRRLTVVMRLWGSTAPISHGNEPHGNSRLNQHSEGNQLA